MYIARPHQKENPVIIDIPLGFVSRVEKVGGARTPGDNYGLDIICKVGNIESADLVLICTEKYLNDHHMLCCQDVRNLRFALTKEGGHPRKDIFECVTSHR